ncbi:hypothetical protein RHGRI_030601 [Rhododendron griersonianum]|uniref:Uncharacterized protein n=1 Tax=Rhododendron griersonianum TaxID=479676 RepID=A0AAV6HJE1_9ERIC|nr:hypothetical protein RHGRI_038519 [Rhododendron griersonianum]KAG5513062.1 hypothetical protein RHGRI_038508 [Rhododendron griersonianum]KAG5523670.1 hypothetical protein RHGRI_030601 [Rhododendron griersonianum]
MRHRNPRFCTRSTMLLMHIIEETCSRWNSPLKQRKLQSRQNQLPPTCHYVHYASTPPTNCTSKDKQAQQKAESQQKQGKHRLA